MVGTLSAQEIRQRKLIINLVITALVLFTITAFGGGIYLGQRHVKADAVDSGAGSYVMIDKYGTVEWRWNGISKDTVASK